MVQQFEPFFSDDHRHGIEQHGVSPTLFYDPLERVVCIANPNHTYEKVLFDPWQQTTWDSNDTVLLDPRIDPDVIEYVGEYFQQFDQEFEDEHGEQPQTWFQARILGNDAASKAAAQKTEPHANTPTVAHLDTLARLFLTITDNGLDAQGNEQKYPTRVVLDIEGNQREVIDAKDRVVMSYNYNMLSVLIYQDSMDAGERWNLSNAVGNPLRAWDSRGHQFRTTYDQLQRPFELFVKQGNGAEVLAERAVYGEAQPDVKTLNLKGRLFQQNDGAGVVTNEAYDFKGNPLRSTRQLLQNPKEPVNWSLSPELEDEIFTSSTTFDALNRPVTLTTPHTPAMQPSVIRPGFNEANLLERVDANLRGADKTTVFVANIDYNAKGQRERMTYATPDETNVTTSYAYEPDTFRLAQLRTKRHRDASVLQDLNYTYDPVGNITEILDNAQQKVFFDNAVVSPSSQYTYDAIYGLVRAEGREHAGQNADIQRDHTDLLHMNLPHANDANALRRYTQVYDYDEVGNILRMIHRAGNVDWTRRYDYAGDSNRLLATSLPGDDPEGPYSAKYEYDEHGSIIKMPHLPVMEWDFKDQLQMTQKQVVNGGKTAEQTRYRYDAAGERVRKITERQNGMRKNERIYLGGFEIYREYNGGGTSITLERETLHIMDDQQRIALVETKTIDISEPNLATAAVIRFQLGNHLGSAALELDVDGAVISYEEYHPYGTSAYRSRRSAAEVSLKQYRYIGKERDDETGFYYCSARYYACWLGRWSTVDPELPLFPQWSPFVYSYANPMTFTDKTGLAPNNISDGLETLSAQRKVFEKESGKYAIETADLLNDIDEFKKNVETNKTILSSSELSSKETEFRQKLENNIIKGAKLEGEIRTLEENIRAIEVNVEPGDMRRKQFKSLRKWTNIQGDIVKRTYTSAAVPANQIDTGNWLKAKDVQIPENQKSGPPDIPRATVVSEGPKPKRGWIRKILDKMRFGQVKRFSVGVLRPLLKTVPYIAGALDAYSLVKHVLHGEWGKAEDDVLNIALDIATLNGWPAFKSGSPARFEIIKELRQKGLLTDGWYRDSFKIMP